MQTLKRYSSCMPEPPWAPGSMRREPSSTLSPAVQTMPSAAAHEQPLRTDLACSKRSPSCAMAEVMSNMTRGLPAPPESAGAVTLTTVQAAPPWSSVREMARGSMAARRMQDINSACSSLHESTVTCCC